MMNAVKLLLAVSTLLLGIGSDARGSDFSSLFFFGDSLTEESGYWLEDGQIWTRYLESEYRSPGGTYANFGAGGTTSAEILGSILGYLAGSPEIGTGDLFVVWGGINDDGTEAGAVVEGVSALLNAGAENVLVLNLHEAPLKNPDLINVFNANLLNGINGLSGNVIQVDVRSLFHELFADPGAYGYPSGASGWTLQDPVYFDGLHMTTTTQGILADYIVSVLEAPALVSVLPELSLEPTRSHLERLGVHASQIRYLPDIGAWVPFVELGTGSLDLDETDHTPGASSDRIDFIAGVSYPFQENAWIGAAVSRLNGDGDFEGNRGDFEMTGTVVSLEGGFRRDRFYLDAAVASTDIDFDSVNRESSLGTATRTNAGQTAGDGFAWEMFSGYRVYRENGVSVTPFAGLRYQDVELDAYTEKEGDSTAMAFAAQERESFLGMAGVTLDYLRETAAGPMRFSGSLRYESEFEDDARSLEAGLTTLPGSRFEMPGYEPESGALNLALAAQATLPRRWEGRVDFSMRSSDAGDRWGFGVGLLKTL